MNSRPKPRDSRQRRAVSGFVVLAALASACGGGGAPRTEAPAQVTGDTSRGAAPADGAGGALREERPVALLPAARASHVWDVKLKRDAVVLEGDAARALEAWQPEPGLARFDASVLTDRTLVAPGRVVLVAGRALFRSRAVREEGGALLVDAEPATLADVIESGTVSWDLQLPIEQAYLGAIDPHRGWRLATAAELEREAGYEPSWRRRPTPRADSGRALMASGDDHQGPSFEAEVTAWPPVWKLSVDPMSYAIRVEPKPGDALELTVIVTRSKKGIQSSIAYKGQGLFSNFRSRTGARYEGGKLVHMSYEQPGLEGDIEVSIAATGDEEMGDFKWQLPGMFKFGYMAGPVPVVVELGLDLTGNVKVPMSASATASSRFRFTSSKGLEWKGVGVDVAGETGGAGLAAGASAERRSGTWLEPTGSVDRMDLVPSPADSAALLGVPVDAQFGVGFPKASVSVFGQGLVPYFRPGAIIGSSLQWGPACKRGYVKFQVGAGVDLKILGHESKLVEKILHESEKRGAQDGCPPG